MNFRGRRPQGHGCIYGNNLHKISSKNKIQNLPFHENQGFQKFYDRNWAIVCIVYKSDATIAI